MPRMRITESGRRHLYLTRAMWADDQHAIIEPECVDAAKALGYAEDPETEPVSAPTPRRRGRPPKVAAAPAPESETLEDKTRRELLEMAKEHEVELPSGYVPHDKLVKILDEQDIKPEDEQQKRND